MSKTLPLSSKNLQFTGENTSTRQQGNNKVNYVSEADSKSESSLLIFMAWLIKIESLLPGPSSLLFRENGEQTCETVSLAGDLQGSLRMGILLEDSGQGNIFRFSKRSRCHFYKILTSKVMSISIKLLGSIFEEIVGEHLEVKAEITRDSPKSDGFLF